MYVVDSLHPRIRFFFWFLLAVFSTFFAEVTVGSAPLVFFKPEGWIFTVPVYGLHILVLAPLVIRPGRVPAWQSLYLAGTIFGLYEAYMTKILWTPTWNPDALRLGGVAVAETLLLVFFWHPVMAFVVPVIFTERFLNMKPSIIPGLGSHWMKRLSSFRFYLITGGLAGALLGTLLADPVLVPQVCLLNGTLITILLLIWNFQSRGNRVEMDGVLPSGKSWRIFSILLLVDFIALGIFIRPEALPSIGSQATIWMLYAGLGYLVYRARLRQVVVTEQDNPSHSDTSSPSSIRIWMAFILPFTFACIAASALLAPLKNYGFLAVFVFGIPSGMFLFYRSILWLFSKETAK